MHKMYLKCRDWREAADLQRLLSERDLGFRLCVLDTGNQRTRTVALRVSPEFGTATLMFNTRTEPGRRALNKSEALEFLREAAQ